MSDQLTVNHRSLFDRLGAGDEAAFDSLYREFHPALCAFANSIVRNRTAAEDVVQDVFVNLWTKRGELSTPTTPRAYLYSAVRNRSLNHLRSISTGDAWAESEKAEAASTQAVDSAQTILEQRDVKDQIEHALRRLSPRALVAAKLRWYEQMSYAEIAEAMGISEKSVENQLSRALKALRAILGA